MKQTSKFITLTILGVALSLCTGCNEDRAEAEESIVNPPLSLADADQTAPAPTTAPAAVPAENAAAATNDIKMVKPAELPEAVKLSPPLQELVKLVQAGVAEDVILAYITNSAEPFYLSSEQVVYLNDLGVSSPILKAAIYHDSKPEIAAKKSVTEPAAPPPPIVAAAETNVPPPPPNTEPVTAPLTPPESYVPPAEPVSTSYFYTSLAPYGNWVDVPSYGLCWQPTVAIVNPVWRPYCDRGRWVYSDCGWYWYSDYSWGWAPFHYGRWCSYPRYGWVWVPGTVWGPSWVTWRYTASHCAWAPLPPNCHAVSGVGLWYAGGAVGISATFSLTASHFSPFIPVAKLCDRTPNRFFVSDYHSKSLYKESTVINNVTVNNNIVHNEGIGIDRVRKFTRTDIPRARLVDAPAPTGKTSRGERIEGSGNSLTVSRPRMPYETKVASVPPANDVKREHGISVYPAGRKQGAVPSNLSDTKSTTVGLPVVSETGGESKGLRTRTQSTGNGRQRINESSPVAKSPKDDTAPVAKNEVNSVDPAQISTVTPAPNRRTGFTSKPASRIEAQPQTPPVVSRGQVTPLPPKAENGSEGRLVPNRNESFPSANALRKNAPSGSIVISREDNSTKQTTVRSFGAPGNPSPGQNDNGRSRNIAASAPLSSAPPAVNTVPGANRNESAPGFSRPQQSRVVTAPAVSAPPVYRTQPNVAPAVRSETVRPPVAPSVPRATMRSAPPVAAPPAVSAPVGNQSAPVYQAPQGGGNQSQVQPSGRGNGNGGGNGGGRGGGRGGRNL